MNSPRILVANGVNLDLLGTREPHIYGTKTLTDLESYLRAQLASVESITGTANVSLNFFQSNSEADFLAKLGPGWDGILVNPGAWSHTSLAIADRLKGIATPYVEVHLSNTHGREDFRHKSFVTPSADGFVAGMGFASYLCGLVGLLLKVSSTKQRTGSP